MEVSVIRRQVRVDPADDADLMWIFQQFDDPDTWQTFGYAGPAMAEAMTNYLSKTMVLGVVRKIDSAERAGFIVMFAPHEGQRGWEFGFVIDRKARDGFTAIAAVDAMTYAMFELGNVEAITFRIRDENRRCRAVVTRLGYRATHVVTGDDGVFHHFEVDRTIWHERLSRLDGEFEVVPRPDVVRWRPNARLPMAA